MNLSLYSDITFQEKWTYPDCHTMIVIEQKNYIFRAIYIHIYNNGEGKNIILESKKIVCRNSSLTVGKNYIKKQFNRALLLVSLFHPMMEGNILLRAWNPGTTQIAIQITFIVLLTTRAKQVSYEHKLDCQVRLLAAPLLKKIGALAPACLAALPARKSGKQWSATGRDASRRLWVAAVTNGQPAFQWNE